MASATTPVRVAVADDSGFMRILISDYLRQDPEIVLVGTANDGKDITSLTLDQQPDVVITDLMMPGYDGLYAVRTIMKMRPTPIVLLSSLDKSDTQVFEALSAGAAEFIGKPKGQPAANGTYAQRLIGLVKSLGRMPRLAAPSVTYDAAPRTPVVKNTAYQHDIVVVGASTGGPAVLENLVKQLPGNLQVPIVIAQHMPPTFIETFAERLNRLSALRIKVAESNEPLHAGTVYLAGGYHNLWLAPGEGKAVAKACYTDQQYAEFNNPSVDCLFASAAQLFGPRVMAVLLTGMGKDGAEGMAKVHQLRGTTLAQDEATCVVFGMAKAAIDKGVVAKIVGAKELPHKMLKML